MKQHLIAIVLGLIEAYLAAIYQLEKSKIGLQNWQMPVTIIFALFREIFSERKSRLIIHF